MVRYELQTPSFYRRLAAWLVDVVILIGLALLITWWCFDVTIFHRAPLLALLGKSVVRNVGLAVAWLEVSYFGLFHGLWGRTPGKAMLELRVVDVSGFPPSQGQIFLRSLLYPGLFIVPSLVLRYFFASFSPWVITTGVLLLYLWMLLDFVMTPIDVRAQRSLHDLMASTRVVVG